MHNKQPYILIVEDEEPISILIQFNLEAAGYETAQAYDGETALEMIDSRTPDLIVLDWMMPKMDGLEVIKDLKQYDETKNIPIIMLTARGEEEDKLKGFNHGADDYLTKPFSPKELVARIKSVLTRAKPQLVAQEISYKIFIVDNRRKAILAAGKSLKLSPTEYDLLEYLIINSEKCCSRDSIIRNVWNDEEIEGRAVDVSIRRVRSAIEKVSPEAASMLKTVRGKGYIIEA